MEKCCYIISYDISNKDNYDDLYDAIKSYGTWAKITESTWGIITSSSAEQVRNFLKSKIDNKDRLFIVKSNGVGAWSNVICSNDWLKKNL